MKKLLLVSALLLFFSAAIFAEEAKIVIKQKSGNETVLELATKPVITFEGGNMVITNDFTQLSLPLDDIEDYVVRNETTGVRSVDVDSQFFRGNLLFNSIPPGSSVYVYSFDGKVVLNQSADQAGRCKIDLSVLPKGTYIVNALGKTIKVVNK